MRCAFAPYLFRGEGNERSHCALNAQRAGVSAAAYDALLLAKIDTIFGNFVITVLAT